MFLSVRLTFGTIASYGSPLSGFGVKTSYIGTATASNRLSGFMPTAISSVRMNDRKS